jgi:FixJ family two-component response regulator/GGDEF domain-containing protein
MARARVLAVDDQRYFRELIEGLLVEAGYEVQTASSGDEALHVLEREDFDIVVTDLVMPGLDGAELCGRIRQGRPDQDIVIVTGVVDVRTAVDAMKLGATDFLLKPFDRETLLGALDAILRQRRLRAEHTRLMEENLEYMGVLSLYERAAALFGTVGLPALAERLIEALCIETRADGGLAWIADALEDDAPLRLVGARGLARGEDAPAQLDLADLSGAVSVELGEGHSCLSTDRDLGEVLWVPLVQGGRPLGVVRLSDKLEGAHFDDADRARAERFAGFASVAVATALRFRGLERRSLRDPVTRAYSAAYFRDVVRNESQKASRFGRSFTVLRFRIEQCPVLRRTLPQNEFARWLDLRVEAARAALRATDLLAAAGEDGFSILLPETDSVAALALQQRIRRALGDVANGEPQSPVLVASATYPVDGTRLEGLETVLEHRLAADATSLARRIATGGLVTTLDDLISRGHLEPREHRDQLARYVVDDVAARPNERALLFLTARQPARAGDALVDALAPLADRTREGCGTQVVVLADGPQPPPAALGGGPVSWLRAPALGVDRSLLLYYGDGPAYALVSAAPRRDGTVPLFHTDDRGLVERLTHTLQCELGMAVAE